LRKSIPIKSSQTHRSVSDWFGSQAAATPDAVAIVDQEERLTYSDLDSRSNKVASSLRVIGMDSECVVGLCTSRSASFVVGALGILKSGAAYLPIDPDLPTDRQSFLLDDCAVPILVTEEKFAGRVGRGERAVIVLNHGRQHQNDMPRSLPEAMADPERLAYVIYTSGSSGIPKGVEVTQANLMNLIEWHQEAFAITPSDRATQLAGLSFDAAVWEIWPYLTAGASVHFIPDDVRTDPKRLRDWLVDHEVTIGFVPTALAQVLLGLDWPSKASLRTMLTGADALHRYPATHLPFQLVNNYGPTECTVVATSGVVPATENCNLPPSIGRPIKNAVAYILDENLQQLKNCEQGELYIGGLGVARAYRNRPDLTAERFISNPFDDGAGSRLYKTGDLAHVLADGQLVFVGRKDEQLKIDGHRIEPNEIVHNLERYPSVQSACVIAIEDVPGTKRLVGYVVRKADAHFTETELRQFLQGALPSYMIPAVFVQMDSLPLTSNGKVDRSALPSPQISNILRDKPFVAPRTLLEKVLAEIVQKLIGLDQVGIEDNFFALGGHSLMAAELIVKLRARFGVDLPLQVVFESPTIVQLSAEIQRLIISKLESMSEAEVQRLEQDEVRVAENLS
jgi:amino acid adenylation domain-containing protein